MKILKTIFDFYIQSSIHVAMSVYAFIQITYLSCQIPENICFNRFAFFGTILGYNFVKYLNLKTLQNLKNHPSLKHILLLTIFSLVGVVYYFLKMNFLTQFLSIFFLVLTLCYALPFLPHKKNARNWAGVKIHIVTLCWVGVTMVLPIVDSGVVFNNDYYLQCLQRWLIVFVLILIFDIIDFANDSYCLQTIPQQIGIQKTKYLGFFLLILFSFLFFLESNFQFKTFFCEMIMVFIIFFFLAFSNKKRSRYYTSFWVESIPVFCWLFLY